jgi:hypothetical protein
MLEIFMICTACHISEGRSNQGGCRRCKARWENRDAKKVLAGKPEGRLFITWRTEEELDIILKRIF